MGPRRGTDPTRRDRLLDGGNMPDRPSKNLRGGLLHAACALASLLPALAALALLLLPAPARFVLACPAPDCTCTSCPLLRRPTRSLCPCLDAPLLRCRARMPSALTWPSAAWRRTWSGLLATLTPAGRACRARCGSARPASPSRGRRGSARPSAPAGCGLHRRCS